MNTTAEEPRISLVGAAQTLAETLLADDPRRLDHVVTAASQAEKLAITVDPADRDILVAAAWLHDIGYVPALRDTGFHPVDGARYLCAHTWPKLIADLVAHHSGARFVADERGLGSVLAAFDFTEDALSDALTIADQTAGPCGRVMLVEDRMIDMLARHGSESPNARAHDRRAPYFRAARDRVRRRLVAADPTIVLPAAAARI
ncbi:MULTISPECIES: HD domain-containing protein [Gordonia]|uniref:HD domain-containing protein n=1 Tax=Gordonia oleivorans TaxID=3156618 RepID=UPI0032B5575F